MEFHKNLSSGSRAVPCQQLNRRTDEETGMTKLTAAYHNFVNTSYKNTTHTGATAFNE